jgi:pentatricopeptide repeat protein
MGVEPNHSTYNAMVGGYLKMGDLNAAVKLQTRMNQMGMKLPGKLWCMLQIYMHAGRVLPPTRQRNPHREPTCPRRETRIAEADHAILPAVPSGAASPQGRHRNRVCRLARGLPQ